MDFTRGVTLFIRGAYPCLVNYKDWLDSERTLISPDCPMIDLTLHTSSHNELQLQPGIPPGVPALSIPGSEAWHFADENSTILFEELKTGPFTIRFTFFRFLKKMTLHYKMHNPPLGARIALKNKWRMVIGDEPEIKLHENQFAMYHAGKMGEKIIFEKGKEYRSFDAMCPPEKMNGLVSLFPALAQLLEKANNGSPSFLVQRPVQAPHEALDIVRDVPDCPFENSLRDYYIEHRLDELLFLLLALALKEQPKEDEPLEDEVKAAYAAEKMIMTDIKQHYSIPAIARKVHLNEFRLKYVFKRIFKTGIFEYLLNTRMQEAKRLLTQTDKPIKEIASLSGYQRLTSFITAFRKHFGYTPGSVRRS
jgi:AraC-like DNA-binding protein